MPKYLVRRLGNKAALAATIAAHIPPPSTIDTWIEPSFGGGGMFFNKGFKVAHNIVNDIDDDVYNLWLVLTEDSLKSEFFRLYDIMPYHQSLLNFWKKHKETEPVRKALRFVFLSGFSFLGMGGALRYDKLSHKRIMLETFQNIMHELKYLQFHNTDANKFLRSISLKSSREIETAFVYADPPYMGTRDNYAAHSWGRTDLLEMCTFCREKGLRLAVSEYLNPATESFAAEVDMRIIPIRKRFGLHQKADTEILLTNYEPVKSKLF